MSAGTVAQLAVNNWIFVRVAAAWQLIGCCNEASANENTATKSFMCQADANTTQKIPGERNSTYSLKGVQKDYTSGEETANWGLKDWRQARKAGTELEFLILKKAATSAPAPAANDKGDNFKAVITSISSELKIGDLGSWSVELDVQGDINEDYTVPA